MTEIIFCIITKPLELWRWQGRDEGRNRKTWNECVEDLMKVLGLHSEWAVFRDTWMDFIWANV